MHLLFRGLKAGEGVLWNLIIADFISGQINARPRSKSGGNLKLEILSGVVGLVVVVGVVTDAYLQARRRKRPESVLIR